MKKLVFVLAVALSACGSASTETPTTKDSTIIDTTKVGVDSSIIDSTKIVDTLKKK
jgi:hypothetical protein